MNEQCNIPSRFIENDTKFVTLPKKSWKWKPTRTVPAYILSSLLALILCTFHLTTNFFLKDVDFDQDGHVIRFKKTHSG